MPALDNSALLIFAFALALLAVIGAAMVYGTYQRHRRDVERLKDDIHELLAGGDATERIVVNGRASDFVDIAASVNRLLDKADEAAARHDGPDRLQEFANAIPDVAWVHTDLVLCANKSAAHLFGLEPAQLQGRKVTDLLRPAYRVLMRKRVGPELSSDAPLEPLEVQLINGDEKGLWAELHSTRIEHDGEPAMVTVARDITHRKSLEASLGRSKLQARVTLESIGEGVITTDMKGTIDYMNEAAEQLIATNRSSAIGRTLPDLIALVDEVDRESLGDPVGQCLAEHKRVSLGRRALLVGRQTDVEFSVELTASPIRGPERNIAGCVVIFHDVTEIRGLAREMSYQASHDALTGLVNRAEFERRLELALASPLSDGAGHVVCYLDLDRFKVVNDSCGHMVGDNLLREIAGLLKDQVRDSDTVARFGGDEFAMLLTGCPLDKATQIAEDVCQAVNDYSFAWRDRVFQLGVSIGLVEVTAESGSAETVLSAADSACYVAKQQGRGRIHVYSARDEVMARQRGEIQWLQKLQSALKENSFELFVQPIIAVGNTVNKGPAAELLLRMRDEAGKMITPSSFLAAAERYHLMSHIDRWVVQSALSALAGGTPHLPEGRVCSINLSGQTLGDDDFLEFTVDLLDHTGVQPSKLCFEVSEAAVLNNIEQARRFVSVLHGIGCQFALDNFGSGIGSVANLKQLSIDYLKIDGAFTRDLGERSINRELLSAMVRLSHSLDFMVVAEQVEDQESFDALRGLGVDFIQGFVVERPRPLAPTH